MISSKQVRNILDYSFSGGGGNFLAPTASFTASPSNYSDSSLPTSINLSGNILINDGTDINWTITPIGSTVILTSGTSTTINHNLSGTPYSVGTSTVPTAIGNYGYNLNISYLNAEGVTNSFTVSTDITVSTAAKIGQLATPGADFANIAEYNTLNSGGTLESGFTIKTESQVVNLFEYTANVTPSGRIVIIIPDIYGNLVDIQDNTDSSVMTQFENPVIDSSNARKLYVTKNALSPATYHYKLVY